MSRRLDCIVCGAYADHGVDAYCPACRAALDRGQGWAPLLPIEPSDQAVEDGITLGVIDWLSRNGAGTARSVRAVLERERIAVREAERARIVTYLRRVASSPRTAAVAASVMHAAADRIEREGMNG